MIQVTKVNNTNWSMGGVCAHYDPIPVVSGEHLKSNRRTYRLYLELHRYVGNFPEECGTRGTWAAERGGYVEFINSVACTAQEGFDREDGACRLTQGYALEGVEQSARQCNESNPCNPADGTKTQTEADFSPGVPGVPVFERHYRSQGSYKTGDHMAASWRHSYSRKLDEAPDRDTTLTFVAPSGRSTFYATVAEACTSGWAEIKDTAWSGDLSTATASYPGGNVCTISSGGNPVAYFSIRSSEGWPVYSPPSNIKTISRPDGSSYRFELDGSHWINRLDGSVKLETSGTNWIFTDRDDTRETYNASGQLIAITQRNGQTETLTYELSTAQGGDGDNSTLDQVTGPFGHRLTFSYDGSGRLASVTTPDGTTQYVYDASGNLASVTDPDTTVRTYVYDQPDLEHHLTGIIDENGDRHATWAYDTTGRAILSEHAGGKERVQFTYNADGTTTLTAGNGATRNYVYTTAQGERKLSMVVGDVCGTCPGGNIADRTYDANGFPDEVIDHNGNITQTARNTRGLTETLIEAKGTPEQRTTTTLWHPAWRLPTKITTSKNVTDYIYDANGNPTSITVSGGGKSRAWTLTYNASGQPLTIDGPRTDVSDVTTLAYYNCTTGAECGQLQSVTNALSQVTTFDSYDASGRVTQMTDPNGLQTSLTYDSHGRVLTTTQTPTLGSPRMTTMTYDNVGQLKTLTQPNGAMLTYAYNAAHYLTSVTDNLGNSIAYDYDAMGNLTDEDTYDPTNTLKQALDYAYDLNYRLDTVNHGGVTSDLAFDLVGNLRSETDPNTHTTQHTYDALNRLDTTIDALTGVIDYGYDEHDNLTQVIAANGATTDYGYDALDNLLSETSPDRGTITYTHDDAGNVLTRTDARGITATYTYDALNRLTSVSYPNTAENVIYGYDHALAEGIGRLTSITDQSGTLAYTYNEFGDIVTDQRLISGISYTMTYQYDAAGNVLSVTYPSGRIIGYGRNVIGEVTQVTSDIAGIPKTIVSSTSYEPFGPLSSLTYGNGVVFNYLRRMDYRITDIDAAGIADKVYMYDPAGNIESIDDGIDLTLSQLYGHDALNRLSSEAWLDPALYATAVLADGPLAYWRLGESGGTIAADATGNGYDATYSGSINLGTPGMVVGSDTAIRIDPLGAGYVDGPVLTGITVTGMEFWFQSESESAYRELAALHNSNADRTYVRHVAEPDGRIGIVRGSSIPLYSDAKVSMNTPHHLAVWYESGTDTTYLMIDGVVQQDTYSGNLLAVNDPKVYVGAYQYGSSVKKRFLGELDEVALYAGAVDASTFSGRFSESVIGVTYGFTYDANGNRTVGDDGSTITDLTYQPFSNRLAAIDGVALQHDTAGNRTADLGGMRTFSYNDAGRLSEVFSNGVSIASYAHNALGQRTTKTIGAGNTVYLYDLFGHLIAEHDQNGSHIRDYVWLDDIPIAQIDQGEVFSYLHFDHLSTPRLATNDNQTIVWRWDSDAFGTTAANEDPDGDMIATTINLRFPGQYYDQETGLHYNYFRTYDPSTGRYLESDPIGLDGGLNMYSYVENNPLMWIDPLGLAKGGKQNLRDTGLSNLTDEEIDDMARKGKTKEERRRAQREQKARQQRNIQKRKRKGNLGKVRGLVPLTIWEILQEHCRQGLHTGLGCLPENDAIAQNSCPTET